MGKSTREATLDNPTKKDLVLSQIRRQHGLEVGVWDLVGIKEGTYYKYKRNHPDFAEKVEQIRAEFEKPVRPCDDIELQQIAKELLKNYVLNGCKTKRLRRIMDAVPIMDADGKPQVDHKGQQVYTYRLKQVIEDIYDNGINFKAYEKILPDDVFSEKALKFIVASQFQHIQETVTNIEQQQIIINWLKQFKDAFYVEMAVITGQTPKKR